MNSVRTSQFQPLDSLLYAEQFRLTRDLLVNTSAYLVSSIAGKVLFPFSQSPFTFGGQISRESSESSLHQIIGCVVEDLLA